MDNTTGAQGTSLNPNTIPMPICNHVCPACGRPYGHQYPVYPYPQYPQPYLWPQIWC